MTVEIFSSSHNLLLTMWLTLRRIKYIKGLVDSNLTRYLRCLSHCETPWESPWESRWWNDTSLRESLFNHVFSHAKRSASQEVGLLLKLTSREIRLLNSRQIKRSSFLAGQQIGPPQMAGQINSEWLGNLTWSHVSASCWLEANYIPTVLTIKRDSIVHKTQINTESQKLIYYM